MCGNWKLNVVVSSLFASPCLPPPPPRPPPPQEAIGQRVDAFLLANAPPDEGGEEEGAGPSGNGPDAPLEGEEEGAAEGGGEEGDDAEGGEEGEEEEGGDGGGGRGGGGGGGGRRRASSEGGGWELAPGERRSRRACVTRCASRAVGDHLRPSFGQWGPLLGQRGGPFSYLPNSRLGLGPP